MMCVFCVRLFAVRPRKGAKGKQSASSWSQKQAGKQVTKKNSPHNSKSSRQKVNPGIPADIEELVRHHSFHWDPQDSPVFHKSFIGDFRRNVECQLDMTSRKERNPDVSWLKTYRNELGGVIHHTRISLDLLPGSALVKGISGACVCCSQTLRECVPWLNRCCEFAFIRRMHSCTCIPSWRVC